MPAYIKYSLSLFATLVISTMSFSQDMNYFLQQKLAGVKNMTLNYYETNGNQPDSASKKIKKDEYIFDEQGRVILFKAYEKESLYLTVEYTYDSSGHLIKEFHTRENKQSIYLFSYTTDSSTGDQLVQKAENGRLIYETKKKQAKNGFFYVDYFDGNGNQIRQEYVDENGKIYRKHFYDTETRIEYHYDKQGNLLSIKTFSAEGASATTHFTNNYTNDLLSGITSNGKSLAFSYDSNGRLILFTDSTAKTKIEAIYTLR